MALKNSKSQTEILESARIALQNVENNPIIKPLMADLGYNTAKIDEGKALLEVAKADYNNNHTVEDNKQKTYKEFEDLRTSIQAKYAKDRKKAKVIFKNDSLILKELHINGSAPTSYVKWLETVTIFYNLLHTNTAMQTQLIPLKITAEHINEILGDLNTLEILRGNYIEAKGIALNATKSKNVAFKTLEAWMSDFYIIARIALENEPKLFESLGR